MRSSLQKQEDTLCYFIRAAAVIPSFHSAVEELLLNSLDANASKITITVNLRLFNVTVEDNGIVQ